jgi:hypothetical protein
MAVASELSRRSYNAAITLGNTPTLDLICTSPSGTPFTVQVKSTSSRNWIQIQKAFLEASPRVDLYLIVALVPQDPTVPTSYYVLTHAEACSCYRAQRRVRLDGQPYKPGREGLSWADVRLHVGQWDKLPS